MLSLSSLSSSSSSVSSSESLCLTWCVGCGILSDWDWSGIGKSPADDDLMGGGGGGGDNGVWSFDLTGEAP